MDKSEEEKKRYIIGLSNTEYMKKAFDSESVLRGFKSHNSVLYANTVGISQKF